MEQLKKYVNAEMLNVQEPFEIDESIKSEQFVEYTPQTQANNNKSGQSINIVINDQDIYTLPSKSYIMFQGQIRRNNNDAAYAAADEIALINNAMMYLFSEIKYDVNGITLEKLSSPGHATSILGYLSQPDDFSTSAGLRMCWSKDTTNHASSAKFAKTGDNVNDDNPNYNQGFATRKSFLFSNDPRGSFTFIIPLSHIFGFTEYTKVLYGLKHTLTLTRTSDGHALYRNDAAVDGKVDISSISWFMPQVEMTPDYLTSFRSLMERKVQIPLHFKARTSDQIALTETRQFTWRLSVTGGVEKPRWIIIALQTLVGDHQQQQNPAVFNHCNLINAYVTLNSERYPNEDITTNFATGNYAKLYDMFDNFKKEFYGLDSLVGGTQVNFPAFRSLFPIIVFDVRRQSEKLKSGVVDMQVKLFFSQNIPANTTAYSIIISDRFFRLDSDGHNMKIISL
jgi:hypothetical protein